MPSKIKNNSLVSIYETWFRQAKKMGGVSWDRRPFLPDFAGMEEMTLVLKTWRERHLKLLREETFDLLVLGGGIVGAAVARDALSRGLKVALIEKSDFASGTSAVSSKLIHGGLRYLESYEWGLVFEALAERTLLLKGMPHLVKPLSFYFPLYGRPSSWLRSRVGLSLGFLLYDLLSLFRTPGWHRFFGKKELLQLLPGLKREALQGGFCYSDALMWDDLLCLEVIREGVRQGGVFVSYLRALECQVDSSGKVNGMWVCEEEVKQTSTQSFSNHFLPEKFLVRARVVVSCLGPWTDLFRKTTGAVVPLLKPSQGSHLIFSWDRFPVQGAVVLSHPSDGRIVFVMPRRQDGIVIVGTTEAEVRSNEPLEPFTVKEEEKQYLFALLNDFFPTFDLKEQDLLATYVGVRPLAVPGLDSGSVDPSVCLQKISREHRIVQAEQGGLFYVVGGKYTTHRKMGEEVLDVILEHHLDLAGKARGSRTRAFFCAHARPQSTLEAQKKAEKRGWDISSLLWDRYGADALIVVELGKEGKKLIHCSLSAEWIGRIRYAIEYEMALCYEDFYRRRLPFYAFLIKHSKNQEKTPDWNEVRRVFEFFLDSSKKSD